MTQIELMIAGTALVALTIVAGAMLRMWQGWLQLKTRELELRQAPAHKNRGEFEGGSREGAARIEIADLKERIRKLEAIASGVDL